MLDNRIYTFLALYDEMNYRKTAERLNMTQPGVTQHIKYLESYYGEKLFEYNGRTLSRTIYAEMLKKHFDSMLAEEKAVRESFEKKERVHINIGATKTVGEFVIASQICRYLEDDSHSLDLCIENTEKLLQMLERSELDFAVIEGVFDKSKYGYHLFKKERFLGVCAKTHRFANKTVTLEETFKEDLIVREKGSGTRFLLETAVSNRGFSFSDYHRCTSVNNFSVICDLVASNNAITFAYEPISICRDALACFRVEDMEIKGEFNFVYCNHRIAKEKIDLIF
ncbi:MAG: LysR family transcriptional regulator [Clostridia bacterium]|nr:LysR family transcriptional regulator [Clostridia bacterium]